MSRIIQPDQLRTGDILLFVLERQSKPTGFCNVIKWHFFEFLLNRISKSTNSRYAHAAICYDATTLAHAPKLRVPVKTDSIQVVLSGCKYAAVFRSSWAFGGNRMAKLKMFIDDTVGVNAAYNTWGILNFRKRKERHFVTLRERLEAHFNGQGTAETFVKVSYFCSEFVAACFCAIGAIEPSAAVVYHPSTTSPVDLGSDPTFGTFIGYLIPSEGTVIPEDDEFYNSAPLPPELGGI